MNRAPLGTVAAGFPMKVSRCRHLRTLSRKRTGELIFILVAGDYFTKWTEAYAIPNQEAITISQKLVDQMFCRFSPPDQLHSDQGK